MKPCNIVKRIEALEEKAAAKAPCREPKTHIVHGATAAKRSAAIRAMIAAGEAASDDIFLLIVSPGESPLDRELPPSAGRS